MPTIPVQRLLVIAEELGLVFAEGDPLDEEMFNWLRHCSGEARCEELNEIEERYSNIDAELDDIEDEIMESADVDA